MTKVIGQINKIIFEKDDFYILSVIPFINTVETNNQTITLKGNIDSFISEKDIFTFDVTETNHKEYGNQYVIENISREYPNSIKYQKELLSNCIAYYGTYKDMDKAKRLINTYDESKKQKPFYKFIDDTKWSKQLDNVIKRFTAPDKYREWAKNYNLDEKQMRDFTNACKHVNARMDKLNEHIASELHNSQIQSNTILTILKYRSINKEPVPSKYDIALFDICVKDAVKDEMENGDTVVDSNKVKNRVLSQRKLTSSDYDTLIHQLNDEFQNTNTSRFNPDVKVIFDNSNSYKLMLTKYYKIESELEYQIHNNAKYKNYYSDFDEYLDEKQISLTEEQKQFATNVFTRDITALTGGAGTGKSFTMGTVVQYLRYCGKRVTCVAPTAQASKVLKGYTKGDAYTIHSFLNDSELQSNTDYLIVDESSMIDDDLMANLLDYLKVKDVKTVFSGDVSQLPPIGCGAPYRDMLEMLDSKVSLTKTFRQKDKSLIDILDTAKKGQFNVNATSNWQELSPIFKYKRYNQVSDTIGAIVGTMKQDDSIGVISPVNRVVDDLNAQLQEQLNPQKNVVKVKRGTKTESFGVGDKIILQENKQYALTNNLNGATNWNGQYLFDEDFEFDCVKAYNGDHGKVVKILNDTQFVVQLDDSDTKLLFDSKSKSEELTTNQIRLGYAMTVHKAQGSQFNTVFFVCPRTIPQMTSKQMVYTALSRAKTRIALLTQTQFSNLEMQRETKYSSESNVELDYSDIQHDNYIVK